MHPLIRLLLVYAAALCLTLAVFGAAPIIGALTEGGDTGAVPWLLLAGGFLGALDCWRLSRRLSKRVADHTRARWTAQRVELFARTGREFTWMLACLTLVAAVLFALLMGLPNTRKWRPDRPLPNVEIVTTKDASGQVHFEISDSDMEKLAKAFVIPKKITIDGLTAGVLLGVFGLTGLLVWYGQASFRRDGRASLVLDENGLEHEWVGRIPWQRVHGMALTGSHREESPFLSLLVADPVPLRNRLPRRVRVIALKPIAPDEPFAEILLSLRPFDCDERRVLSAAKRLHAGAAPPLNTDWRPGLDIESVRSLALTAATTPAAAVTGDALRLASSRTPAPPLALTWGDRLSILWVSSMSLLAAVHLLVLLLFGADGWPMLATALRT